MELLYQVRQFRYFEVGRISVVDMATRYRLDGPGIESQSRRDFPHTSRLVLVAHGLLYNGYRVFLRGKGRGRGVDYPRPSSAEVKEGVELFIYFPLGLHGLL